MNIFESKLIPHFDKGKLAYLTINDEKVKNIICIWDISICDKDKAYICCFVETKDNLYFYDIKLIDGDIDNKILQIINFVQKNYISIIYIDNFVDTDYVKMIKSILYSSIDINVLPLQLIHNKTSFFLSCKEYIQNKMKIHKNIIDNHASEIFCEYYDKKRDNPIIDLILNTYNMIANRAEVI